jgi:hypothetical protein
MPVVQARAEPESSAGRETQRRVSLHRELRGVAALRLGFERLLFDIDDLLRRIGLPKVTPPRAS